MKLALGSILVIVGVASGLSGTAGAATTSHTATHYYVDCMNGNDTAPGTTPAAPWKTLSKVNSTTYGLGDIISFRTGTTCAGTLMPTGSGTKTAPIVVNSYNSGAKPKIVASGARAAVFLRNVQGWEIRNLDISNQGESGVSRAGIYVELEDYGVGQHFVVNSVRVHDVNGCDCTINGPLSGGILFNATGSTTPTGFSDIKVSNNTVTHVDGIVIGTASQWSRRFFFFARGPGTTWVPMPSVVVKNNRLSNMGHDGIVIENGSGALVQKNILDGFGLRAKEFHTGIWSLNSDRTLIQYNEIAHGGGPLPAEAFDVNRGNDKFVYQYNYTHDNNGGMLVACADADRQTRDTVVQFNTSKNDLDGAGGVITIACEPQENLTFAHNSVDAPRAATMIKNFTTTPVNFTNNVFKGRPAGSVIDDLHSVFKGNVFVNITNPPSQLPGAR